MCLIAFAWKAHPRFDLVVVANRDEFHERPTSALAEWGADAPGVYGGRDLREGGGWLALDPQARRLAAVTNVREMPLATAPRSRGALVRAFVSGSDCAAAFSEHIRIEAVEYGPFNLLCWDGEELIYATNRRKPRWETVTPGLHGLSNGALDDPWPKSTRLTAALQNWLDIDAAKAAALPDLDVQPLLTALHDDHRAADADLPDTGIGLERERFLSPPFICSSAYGTRASSVVLIERGGGSRFHETRFGPEGAALGAPVDLLLESTASRVS